MKGIGREKRTVFVIFRKPTEVFEDCLLVDPHGLADHPAFRQCCHDITGGNREKAAGGPKTDFPDAAAENLHKKLIRIAAGTCDHGMTARFIHFSHVGRFRDMPEKFF